MSSNLTPYDVCVALIGAPEKIGPIVGAEPKSPYRWRYGSKWRDAGDIPSARLQRVLLTHSFAHGLGLTADHLIWGATPEEIAEILASREIQSDQVAAE